MNINKINIPDLKLVIKDNCIGFEGIGNGDFTNINIPPNQLKVAYEYIISKYPDVKDVLLTIANTIINNNYGPKVFL